MATLFVSTQTQLASAVKNAASGDIIALAPGTYNDLTISKSSASITITSASLENQAVINKLLVRGSSNIEFKDITFDYDPSKSGSTPFWVEGSRGVSFVNATIEGHIAGTYGDGVGLRIKNSSDVTVSGSEISDFRNGIYASNSTDVDLLNNEILGMSNDGMLLGGMTDLLIAGNEFRDQKSNPTVKHKDSIQFLTSSGEAGSQDVIIRDNLIQNKEVSHGVFFTNSVYNNGDPNSYHRNILIEDNVVLGNQVHGISVNHGYGVTIRGNVVEQIEGATNVPLINASRYSAYVLITENQVASAPLPQNATWTVVGNDVGAKQRQHWYGDPGAPVVAAPTGPAPSAPTAPTAPTTVDTSGARVIDGALESGTEVFRIGGVMLKSGTTRFLVEDLDVADGDMILFNNLDAGTFQQKRGGNAISIWNDGASAKVDSALDFQELASMSPDVSATTSGDWLTLRIDHADGVAEVIFAGLGDAFRAANTPELF